MYNLNVCTLYTCTVHVQWAFDPGLLKSTQYNLVKMACRLQCI